MEETRLCNDVLLQIFLRVPIKSVFRFKCVSKYWRHRLSEKNFRKMYESRRTQSSSSSSSSLLPLYGFFHASYGEKGPSEICVASFAPACKQSMFMRSRKYINNRGFLMGCSNGLILCGYFPSHVYVCNPMTDQFVQLPPAKIKEIFDPTVRAIGFLYEDDVPSYTIIRADCGKESKNLLLTETYTSESRVWRKTLLRGAVNFRLNPNWPYSPCKVIGGIFYWMAKEPKFLVARDPKAKHDWVWQIRFPRDPGVKDVSAICNIQGESSTTDGYLLFGYHVGPSRGFRIARLRRQLRDYSPYTQVPSSEWISIHYVLFGTCPKIPPPDKKLLTPITLAFHPQSFRFILMKCRDTLFWYDVETGETNVPYSLWCLPVPFVNNDHYALVPYFQPEWPPSPYL